MEEKKETTPPAHFKGKDALGHVIDAKEAGILNSAEIHGTEISGPLSAFADSLRETALFLSLTLLLLAHFQVRDPILYLLYLSFAWLLWKGGRSAWLGWSRLERLHRIVQEERWEIKHHRQQERDELKELYEARGFSGKLLEDVIDTLMNDGDRLLRVMVEEELSLKLENQEHPLKQGLAASFGVILAFLALALFTWLIPSIGSPLALALLLGVSGCLSASFSGNERLPAVLWHLGLGALSFGTLHFLLS